MKPYFEENESGKLLIPKEYFFDLKVKAKKYEDLIAQKEQESKRKSERVEE